ncbi:MAG: hypothetical protein KGH79_00185 [Patescibacteria group bacterium]|nr:hypothetical protein [Patescibacteria group bacterium]
MNTLSKIMSRNLGIASMAAILMILPLAFAAAPAHADDFGNYGSMDYYPTTTDYGSMDYYPTSYGSMDYYPANYGSMDYYPSSYSSDYLGSSGYMTSSYLGGGYLMGGGYLGSSYLPSNTNVNTNVIDNGNSCTAINSCNTTVSSPTTVTTVTNPAPQPVIYNNPPVVYNNPTPVCNTCGCIGYPVCPQPIAYNSTPYVSLSAVPYTGLDLGFWGTIAYWGFLILWCLAAAYLIVVKRVQNRIFRAMKNFLFGNASANLASRSPSVADSVGVRVQQGSPSQAALDINALAQQIAAILNPSAVQVSAPIQSTQEDVIDDFILSQINRPRSRTA